MRKTSEELDKIKQKYNIDTLWSWSRINLYQTDKYSYYLQYILKAKEDRNNSAYAPLGQCCHRILEDYYNGEIQQEDMIKQWEDELFTFQMSDMKFDRNDATKNESIQNKYVYNINHFFKHHYKPDINMVMEPFVLIHINDSILLQGYVDCLGIVKDDNKKKIIVSDFKTSTLYTGAKLVKESPQLFLYAEGIHQKTKLPYSQIIVQYNFLKYITARCLQANGQWKERHIERNSISESLSASVKMWLKKEGYKDKVDEYIEEMILTNSIDGLPDSVKEKFIITDCYVEVPYDENTINELKEDIIQTVAEIEEKTREYEKTGDDRIFWQEVNDSDSYRLAVLSGFSRNIHKPYDEYLLVREQNSNNNNDEEDIMSWLNKL